MITEDYVSFETAKLLKEKGFDEGCRRYWYKGKLVFSGHEIWNRELDNYYEDKGWTAPTLQMAMKWLREVHKLEIYPYHQYSEKGDKWWFEIVKFPSPVSDYESNAIYATYEEAAESAIKYCLENLI